MEKGSVVGGEEDVHIKGYQEDAKEVAMIVAA
jgi:hypothetical protein